MTTGDCATLTGLYESDCACRARAEVRRGSDAPACPKCRKSVRWIFQRSVNMKGPPGEPPGSPAGDRGRS
jgi:hypothetical protein